MHPYRTDIDIGCDVQARMTHKYLNVVHHVYAFVCNLEIKSTTTATTGSLVFDMIGALR